MKWVFFLQQSSSQLSYQNFIESLNPIHTHTSKPPIPHKRLNYRARIWRPTMSVTQHAVRANAPTETAKNPSDDSIDIISYSGCSVVIWTRQVSGSTRPWPLQIVSGCNNIRPERAKPPLDDWRLWMVDVQAGWFCSEFASECSGIGFSSLEKSTVDRLVFVVFVEVWGFSEMCRRKFV